MQKFKVKKGDEVIVITGKDKGKKGKILKIITKLNRAIVSGINLVKKHTKPSQNSEGGIIQKELSIHISNIACVDPKLNSATKIAIKTSIDGLKVRVAKKSGELISVEGK
ncbi:MAG: 50S ribosomal protein L24 [Rickettsiaceae bacterium]|nr:MAG: 50S ribosomal protein L24 [Rickettsiaceae bacterium]